MAEQHTISFRPETLSIEVWGNILRYSRDLPSLLAAVESCRFLHAAYQNCKQQILSTIFQNMLKDHSFRRHPSGSGFLLQLHFVIRRDIIPRDNVEKLFNAAWPIFEKKGALRFLIPLGRVLAGHLPLDKRERLRRRIEKERFVPRFTVRLVGGPGTYCSVRGMNTPSTLVYEKIG
jgi:hypothetical protein